MTTLLLDTHVVHWLTAESELLSDAASQAIAEADDVVVASISWYELAWLGEHGRLAFSMPVRSWIQRLSERVRTIDLSPAIAATAVALPRTFPRDPVDRIIFATAIEEGCLLVTRDERIRAYPSPRQVAIW